MSRINPIVFAVIIIIAIAGISVALPVVYLTEINKEAMVGEDWTPIPSETSTPSMTPTTPPTFTSTPDLSYLFSDSSAPEEDVNCIYPFAYWKEHPELWVEMLVGNTMLSQDEIRLIFDDNSRQAYPILLQQQYLTNLNIISGADPTAIQGLLVEANIWIQVYSPDEKLPEKSLPLIAELAQGLMEFNTGIVGPGFCSPYQSLTVTPITIELPPTRTQTLTETATSTATSVPTRRPTATATKTEKPESKPKPPKPTDPPPPEPTDPPPPPPTDPPPTDPPPPEPTSAPPEPTDPPEKPPTPAP